MYMGRSSVRIIPWSLKSLNENVSLDKVVRVDRLGNLANYKKDYNVSLFHVVCTVTVMIFCSRRDASLVYWPFAHLHLKAFY